MEESIKVVRTFSHIDLVYITHDNENEAPSVSECVIFNDGTIRIREKKPGYEGYNTEEFYKADVYDLVLLYGNIKSILESDYWNREVPVVDTPTTEIHFRIVYSDLGHYEECSPLLSDENGISIVAVIDGFVSFAKHEHTYYNWYSVLLNEFSDKAYSYFYDDDSIKIGDRVVVPVGPDNRPVIGRVVNFWRIAEERLPYPAEKTKKIIRKVEPFSVENFLKNTEFTSKTRFEITDIDGNKVRGKIAGDYKSTEPYLQFITSDGSVIDFAESRIASIRIID